MTLTIDREALDQRVRKETAGLWSASGQKFLGVWDGRLWCPTVAQVRQLSGHFYETLAQPAKTESFDCEDQSLAFIGAIRAVAARDPTTQHSIACGLVMGHFSWVSDFKELHVCCWVAVDDGGQLKLRLLEPQRRPPTDKTDGWMWGIGDARDIRLMFI